MTSYQTNPNSTSRASDPAMTDPDLFAEFIQDGESSVPDNILSGSEPSLSWMTTNDPDPHLSDAIAAVEQELHEETEAASVALAAIQAALQATGTDTKPEVAKGLKRLSGLVQGVQQGVKGHFSDIIQKQFTHTRQALQQTTQQLHSAQDLDQLFNIAVTAIQQFLDVDRVLIVQFQEGDRGTVVTEAIEMGWTPALSESLPALCFGRPQPTDYLGKPVVLDAVKRSMTMPYQQQLMERFQVQAMVTLPLAVTGTLWGLLVVQYCRQPRHWQELELYYLTQIVAELTPNLQIASFQQKQQQWVAQARILNLIVNQIYQANTVEQVFRTATDEVRQYLKCDRVAVYRFNPDWTGEFVAESVGSGWTALMQEQFDNPILRADINQCSVKDLVHQRPVDTHLRDSRGGRFTRGEIYRVCYDIHNSGFSQCYIQMLERYQAKAYVMVAIYDNDSLWGLLAVYQCSNPRQWSDAEVGLLTQVGTHLNIALQQSLQTQQLTQSIKREQAIAKLVPRILQSKDEAVMFRVATQELRYLLNCDRVGIYRFADDWGGEFVSESVASGWVPLVGDDIKTVWDDTHLQDTQGGRYAKQESFVVNDIYAVGHSLCHVEILEQFQVKAYMIAPIFYQDKLWGLLGAYQNSDRRVWADEEIQILKQIGTQLGVALQQLQYNHQLQQQSQQLALQSQRDKNYARVIGQIGQRFIERIKQQNLNLEEFLVYILRDVRQVLQTDRIGVYQFNSDWSGQFIVEDVGADWLPLVGTELAHIKDTYLQESQGGRYSKNQSLCVNDVRKAGHADCHVELLENWGTKAYIVVPIFKGNQLWGLLGAYHNRDVREWEDTELTLLTQVGSQLGNAFFQAEVIEQVKQQSEQLSTLAEQEKVANQQLQQRIIQMLSAVRPALQGDLTVRAPVTEDAVGTVADAYNNTIQSLRQLVTQVKTAAAEVGETSQINGGAIAQLTQQTQDELAQVTKALNQLESMVAATQSVSQDARRVEAAVQQANETVQQGDNAMNLTVEGILAIRETVSEATKKIKRLSESSQKISKVVSLIGNFTTQTQLLALNAAIEATRAGEYGRGFAVVADEVRSLAQQSSEATGEIEKLVQEIQSETSAVSTAMDAGIQQVVQGTHLVTQTRQSLNDIVTATAQIRELIQGITSSAQAQMQQSEAVTTAMSDVAAIARKTSTDSIQIATSFQALLKTAEDLQTSVDQFKVK
jgi:methyl-accepting chemotaxis protein PixJ